MYRKSALELRNDFLSGVCSAEDITRHFLRRIEKWDKEIGAFLQIFPESAIRQARELDAKKKEGKPLGKLAGIPFAIKDNIHIKGEKTTCASKFLSNYEAVFDATTVRLLKEEDAVLIGKTNLDEFAMGGSTEHSAFLDTRNPWDLKRTPGGSSGGSAAAVAGRLVPLALGSDTGGSVRQPAAYCGIIGYKPTYGRVSRYGLVAFGSSLDQVGPFAWNTEDLALTCEVLNTHCPHDATSIDHPNESFSGAFKKDLKGVRIGIPFEFLKELSGESKNLFERSVAVFKELGASIVDVDLTILKYAIPTYYIIATAEASTNLARFDGIRYGNRDRHAQTLDQIYDLSRENGFGFEVKRRILLGTYVLSSGFSEGHYKKALRVRSKIIHKFLEAFSHCDLILTPTAPSSAFELGSVQDPVSMYLVDLYTVHANLTGLPALSIPSQLDEKGLPFGVQLIAPAMKDAFLVGCAHAFETRNPINRKIPSLVEEK